jgi:hypothetical protein
MAVKYKVYNILTNTHDTLDTLAEAKELKAKLVDEMLKEKLEEVDGLCGVTAVNINEDGNEVWVPVETKLKTSLEATKYE